MQLKIQRSQRTGGFTGATVFFSLDVRAEYSPEERSNIARYKLGPQIIYNSRAAKKHLDTLQSQMDRTRSNKGSDVAAGLARGVVSLAMAKLSLNISIASLGKGHHIECKDLEELLEAEDTVRQSCKNVTRYLEVAATFDGSETVIEYEGGEERVHVAQHAQPLIAYAAANAAADCETSPPPPSTPPAPHANRSFDEARSDVPFAGGALKDHWFAIEQRILAFTQNQGWNVDEFQVRLVCGAGAVLTLVVLWNIL